MICDVCARHGARLGGGSPLTTIQEEGLAKDKGVAARRGLKEVRSKALTRRTEIASEARMLDKAARHVKVQTLNGKHLL